MHRYVLASKDWHRHEQGQQQHCTLVDHDETSAVCEGTEIRLTELRNLGCWSSVEKLAAVKDSPSLLAPACHKLRKDAGQTYDVSRQHLFHSFCGPAALTVSY
jgi:hypothetical protein